MITIKSLSGISVDELVDTFNLSFSDYIVIVQLTKKQLESKLHSENIRLDLSAGAFRNNQLVGFILHGIRGDTFYNAGTGVIPTERGNGITQQLYEYIIPILKKEDIFNGVLEVIKGNEAAIRSYQKIGFYKKKLLACYVGKLKTSAMPKRVHEVEMVNYYEALESWSCWKASWQFSSATIKRLGNHIETYLLKENNTPIAYISFSKRNNRIYQLGINKGELNDSILTTLFSYLPDELLNNFSLINVPDDCLPILSYFKNENNIKIMYQYEMEINLNK